MDKMLKAATYGRYSTDLQCERSIEDQVSLCRDFASRNGIEIVASYEDRAKSSATLFDRNGFINLMRDASTGRFNCVLVESLDRISRDPEDLAGIFKRLTFAGIEIHTVSEGKVDHLLVGIRSLTGSLFMRDLADKVRRGMVGRAKEGSVLGRITYGYQRVQGQPGKREIDPNTSAVVKRIFKDYVSGMSPRAIARDLNAEGVTPPGKKPWSAQLVSGGKAFFGGKGILTNRMYIGEVSFGRSTTVLNPNTGRKVRRPGNPVTVTVPELRIVDQDTWDAAQAIQASRAKVPGQPRKLWSRHDGLLAGMVTCSECGSNMIIGNRSRNGTGRYVCSNAHFEQGCQHRKSYDSLRLEEAVVDAIGRQLRHPRSLIEIVSKFGREMLEARKTAKAERERTAKRVTEIEASMMRLAGALERGSMPEDILIPKLQALETERAGLKERERLADQEESATHISNAAIIAYAGHLENLHRNLTERRNDPDVRMAFRNAIKEIVVSPTPARQPYQFEIKGRLGALLGIDLYPLGRPVGQILDEQGVRTALKGQAFQGTVDPQTRLLSFEMVPAACSDSTDARKAG